MKNNSPGQIRDEVKMGKETLKTGKRRGVGNVMDCSFHFLALSCLLPVSAAIFF